MKCNIEGVPGRWRTSQRSLNQTLSVHLQTEQVHLIKQTLLNFIEGCALRSECFKKQQLQADVEMKLLQYQEQCRTMSHTHKKNKNNKSV